MNTFTAIYLKKGFERQPSFFRTNMLKKSITAGIFMLFLLVLTGAAFSQAPSISSFTPTSGPVGTLVTITGTNLSNPTAFTIWKNFCYCSVHKWTTII